MRRREKLSWQVNLSLSGGQSEVRGCDVIESVLHRDELFLDHN